MKGINNENWVDKSLKETIELGILKSKYAMHTSIPAVVNSYDYTTQKAVVTPLIKRKIDNLEEEESLPSIPSVPVGHPNSNGGNTFIHMPIKSGDIGWLHFSEVSMKEFLSSDSNKVVNSKSYRRFNLADAIFEPKVRPFNNSLSPVNGDDLEIKHDDIFVYMNAAGTIQIKNSNGSELLTASYDFMTETIDLAGELDNLYTALATFTGALSGAVDSVVVDAAATLNTYLAITAPPILTSIVGNMTTAQTELGDLKT